MPYAEVYGLVGEPNRATIKLSDTPTEEVTGTMAISVAGDHAAASVSPASAGATEKYCPECGRLFSEHTVGVIGQPARRSRFSWGLLALGVYLLVLFGPRAVNS